MYDSYEASRLSYLINSPGFNCKGMQGVKGQKEESCNQFDFTLLKLLVFWYIWDYTMYIIIIFVIWWVQFSQNYPLTPKLLFPVTVTLPKSIG